MPAISRATSNRTRRARSRDGDRDSRQPGAGAEIDDLNGWRAEKGGGPERVDDLQARSAAVAESLFHGWTSVFGSSLAFEISSHPTIFLPCRLTIPFTRSMKRNSRPRSRSRSRPRKPATRRERSHGFEPQTWHSGRRCDRHATSPISFVPSPSTCKYGPGVIAVISRTTSSTRAYAPSLSTQNVLQPTSIPV